MRVNYKLVKHLSFSIILSMGLIACGGGSSDNGSGNGDSGGGSDNGSGDGNASGGDGAGSGGCVSYPRPVVGQIVKRELKGADGDISITKETEITAISNTTITQKIESEIAGIDFDSTITDHFTIANNYMDTTKEVSTFGTTTYVPFKRTPIDEVCEGQTWNSTYTETDSGDVRQISHTFTVEAVNVSKTTALGTFNTFRITTVEVDDNVSIEGTTWIDINTGYDVLSEFGDTDGNLEGSLELVEKNF